jgi:hypothetical protein
MSERQLIGAVYQAHAVLCAIQALIAADSRIDEAAVSIDRIAGVGKGILEEALDHRPAS